MKSSWLAHLSEDGRQQSVLEHLRGTAQRSCLYAQSFGVGEQGELAGLAHDLGKYTAAFQHRLLQKGPKVDHATAGAFECLKRGQVFAAFAVARAPRGTARRGQQDGRIRDGHVFGAHEQSHQGRSGRPMTHGRPRWRCRRTNPAYAVQTS